MSKFTVNAKAQNFNGDPETPLLLYLRDIAVMTGTKFGCGRALCGACTVHLDGTAVRSCQVQVGDIDGQTVIHHEGLLGRRQSSCAEGVGRGSTCAVRLLPDRPDHAGGVAAQGHAHSHGPADPRRHERQHLPLRHLSAHSGRHQARLGQGIREDLAMTNITEVANVARRSVLLGLAAGTFVLSVRFPRRHWRRTRSIGVRPAGWAEYDQLFSPSPITGRSISWHSRRDGQAPHQLGWVATTGRDWGA